jgi:hypothetical protein
VFNADLSVATHLRLCILRTLLRLSYSKVYETFIAVLFSENFEISTPLSSCIQYCFLQKYVLTRFLFIECYMPFLFACFYTISHICSQSFLLFKGDLFFFNFVVLIFISINLLYKRVSLWYLQYILIIYCSQIQLHGRYFLGPPPVDA